MKETVTEDMRLEQKELRNNTENRNLLVPDPRTFQTLFGSVFYHKQI